MGVYISGMEVPKEAGTYRIEFDQCGNPYLLSENGDLGLWHIISVPAHGRLIDADAAVKKLKRLREYHSDDSQSGVFIAHGISHCIEVLTGKEAPTIIQADPVEEGAVDSI